jgi:hypothetical protein
MRPQIRNTDVGSVYALTDNCPRDGSDWGRIAQQEMSFKMTGEILSCGFQPDQSN